MKYKIFTTAKAEEDLSGIYEYLAYKLFAGENATRQIERIEKGIMSLDEFSERHHIYEKEPWKSRNSRVMQIDNYMVFYISDSDRFTVTIVRVMYGRRDVSAILSE